MPSNIEIKARVDDLAPLRIRALALGARSHERLQQVDTFYRVSKGRLKLREFGDGAGELIFYERSDRPGPKRSDYVRYPTSTPAALHVVLDAALGTRGIVEKGREVLLMGQTRIHFDEVRGLGSFLELEVVLVPNQPAEEGEQTAQRLLSQLEVPRNQLISCAYIDILEEASVR